MRFYVRYLRFKGRRLPNRDVANQKPVVGDLRIEEVHDEELKRALRSARVVDPVFVMKRELPTLYDVHLVAISTQAFTLSGFERVDGCEYVQSWLVRPE